MDNTMLLSIIVGVGLVGLLIYLLVIQPKKGESVPTSTSSKTSNSLQLQAYERLTLLVDRIALPNLVSRTPSEGLMLRDMQYLLTKNIRDEFDYNVTQQIYVTPESWNAVRNLKEKNILSVNQVAQALPPESTGMDLQKGILQFIMSDPKANTHELVSEALSYEAKKFL